MTQARFPSLVGLRLRAFGAKPPSELTLSDKLDIILHGLNLNKTVGLAVAASVQKYIRNTQRFDNH